MKITDLAIDTIGSVGSKMLLTGITPTFRYENGVRTTTIDGYRYSCVCQERTYLPIEIKIAGENKLPDYDFLKGCPVVTFDNLNIFIYWSRGEYTVGCSASDVHIVGKNA